MNPTERPLECLRFLLRAIAIVTLLAIGAVVMPHAWMDRFHQSMGMGSLPDLPIIHYLARSLSAFYFWFALLVLFISRDLPRYLPFIRFLSITGVGLGVVLTAVDWHAGLPWWWTVSEGVFLLAYFGATWWLCERISKLQPAES